MLHRTIAFPLLKKFSNVGDLIAKRIFKEGIAKRIESGNLTVIQYLIRQRYLDYLNKEDLNGFIQNYYHVKPEHLKILFGLVKDIGIIPVLNDKDF